MSTTAQNRAMILAGLKLLEGALDVLGHPDRIATGNLAAVDAILTERGDFDYPKFTDIQALRARIITHGTFRDRPTETALPGDDEIRRRLKNLITLAGPNARLDSPYMVEAVKQMIARAVEVVVNA